MRHVILFVLVCGGRGAVCLYIKIYTEVCVHTYLYLFVRAAAAAAKQESSIGLRLVLIRLGVYSLGIGSLRCKKLLRGAPRNSHTQMKRRCSGDDLSDRGCAIFLFGGYSESFCVVYSLSVSVSVNVTHTV